ncbi:TerC family protein [Neisseriaceae bacterium CLB008]|nr:TerC family protein [Neisseriaceae bacterium]
MDLSWVMDPRILVGFVTLLVLEIVLGIDNLVFVAILANKVRPELRDRARIMGLSMAIVIRVIMLGFVSYIITLTNPLFHVGDFAVSVKDLIMMVGGLFLLYKATMELHERLEGHNSHAQTKETRVYSAFGAVVVQILVLDAVFSIDSVITAVAMVDHITVAMLAVAVAMAIMIWASKPLTAFVDRHPTVVMLCLGFLLMIGFSLIVEGLHYHIPKEYLYVAIGFSILIEVFNQIAQKNSKKNLYTSRSWRHRLADNVLGAMGVRDQLLAKERMADGVIDDGHFDENERSMIRSVLTLAERPILGMMTPRRDIERLDISQTKEQQIRQLKITPFSRLVVVGKAGIDEALGYVNKKDLLTQYLTDGQMNINEAIRKPLILLENTTALRAMEQFRGQTADLAFVVDEFGTILGLVTMKDLLETIAGDFPEEYESEEGPSIQANGDESFTVDGSLEYSALEQQLGLAVLEEDVDYHTVAGLVMEELQRIPKVGDCVDYQDWRFEVIEMANQRIERVKIYAIPYDEA